MVPVRMSGEHLEELPTLDHKNATTALRKLLGVALDSAQGFDTAANGVSDLDLQHLLREYAERRREFAEELRLLVEKARPFDSRIPRSPISRLHRRWIALREKLEAGNPAVALVECERGERRALDAYREALELPWPGSVADVLMEHMQDIREAHDAFDKMRRPW